MNPSDKREVRCYCEELGYAAHSYSRVEIRMAKEFNISIEHVHDVLSTWELVADKVLLEEN